MAQKGVTFTVQHLNPASNKFREQGSTNWFGVKTTMSTKSVWKVQYSQKKIVEVLRPNLAGLLCRGLGNRSTYAQKQKEQRKSW